MILYTGYLYWGYWVLYADWTTGHHGILWLVDCWLNVGWQLWEPNVLIGCIRSIRWSNWFIHRFAFLNRRQRSLWFLTLWHWFMIGWPLVIMRSDWCYQVLSLIGTCDWLNDPWNTLRAHGLVNTWWAHTHQSNICFFWNLHETANAIQSNHCIFHLKIRPLGCARPCGLWDANTWWVPSPTNEMSVFLKPSV